MKRWIPALALLTLVLGFLQATAQVPQLVCCGGSGGGVAGLLTANAGTALADNAAVRGDGTAGIQGSLLDIDDSGNATIPDGAAWRWSDLRLSRLAGPILQVMDLAGTSYRSVRARAFEAHNGTTMVAALDPASSVNGLRVGSGAGVGWESAASPYGGGVDLFLGRSAASVGQLTNGSTGGATLELTEMSAPSAPAANKARLFCQDNGAGKTQCGILFPSGVAQIIATEP